MNVHYSLHTFYFIVWLYWRKINIYYLACYCLILILNIPVQRWIHHQEISTIRCWYSRFADPGMGLCCVWQRLTYFIKTIQSRLATKIFGALWNIKYTKGNPELLSSWNATSNQQILPSSQTLLKEEVMNRVLHMILFQFLSFLRNKCAKFLFPKLCVCIYIYKDGTIQKMKWLMIFLHVTHWSDLSAVSQQQMWSHSWRSQRTEFNNRTRWGKSQLSLISAGVLPGFGWEPQTSSSPQES